jgi:UDP-glucose 4-epimerase
MKFLITGVCGFLGSALSNRLSKEGHIICGLDDLSAGNPKALTPEIEFTRGDINDRTLLWSLLQGVDCVFHLAAKVIVRESLLFPRDYNQVNVGGTVTLMEAMRDVGAKRVVFISSGAIYGSQDEQPLSEDRPPNPQSPYAVSKLSAEYYIRTIGALWGLETVCLRVFNAYGPGQNLPPIHGPVIPNFLRQASLNGTLVVHTDGSQTRDYVYLDDVVNAMISAATTPDINRLILNVGSGSETSVRELIRILCEVTGGKPEVVYNPRVEAGPQRMCADLTLSRQKLNFQPTTSLETGLDLTYKLDSRFQK